MSLPQYPESYWLHAAATPKFDKLEEDITVDVAIVGGGISGITTAYLLTKRGLKVVLVEAGTLLTGTTGHTTAKITAQHDLIYDEYISHFGKEQARLYYEANDEALQFIRRQVRELGIDCNLIDQDAYVYTTSTDQLAKLAAEFAAYEALGIPSAYVEQTPLPLSVKGAVVMKEQAQFHPVSYLTRMVQAVIEQGGRIFENTAAISADHGQPCTVTVEGGHTISCDYIATCSHYPFYEGMGFYFARMHPERSYALAVQTNTPYPGGMYVNAEDPKRSLRSISAGDETWVLLGGESHKTGQGICTVDHYEALRVFGEDLFGISKIHYRWSAQDYITLDKLPFIGRTTAGKPNILVATGFKKWGMTTGTAAAILIDKLIAGEQSPYEALFGPTRFPADPSWKSAITENANVAKHLIAGKLEMVNRKPEDLGIDEGGVVTINGKRAGAYRDEDNKLYMLDTTCTHMGCEVEWNTGERTWDCPCHGSRFSFEGEVLEGPAKKPLKRIEDHGE